MTDQTFSAGSSASLYSTARPRPLRVFVSSTSEDLREYRDAVKDLIVAHEWVPVMMEHMGAQTRETVETCVSRIAECDLVILLVAFRRGWVPSVDQGGDGKSSITALELKHARAKGVDVLPFLAADSWPGRLWEGEQANREWVDSFRANLNQPADFFTAEEGVGAHSETLPKFRITVGRALLEYKRLRMQRERALAGDNRPAQDSVYFTKKALLAGTRIPFIGCELGARSGLSSRALASALAAKSAPKEAECLATAAEFVERAFGRREDFLHQFRQLIRSRSEQATTHSSSAFEVLARVPRLPLIVSTTWDTSLEEYFRQAGLSYAVVTHILSSADGELDGRILVALNDGSFDVHLADKMPTPQVDRVIYRPLGAPFVQETLPPDLDIDTVVVTESDHLTFIKRLQNQHTQIPTPFHRPFQRFPLLFLGYALDVWQYRLIMQVFNSVQILGKVGSMVAVREPETPLERLAWECLGARLHEMSPEKFCDELLEEMTHTEIA